MSVQRVRYVVFILNDLNILFDDVIVMGEVAVEDSLLLLRMLVEETVVGLQELIHLLLYSALGVNGETHALRLHINKFILLLLLTVEYNLSC
jgi:hypothetical protein